MIKDSGLHLNPIWNLIRQSATNGNASFLKQVSEFLELTPFNKMNQNHLFEALIDMAVLFVTCPDDEVDSSLAVNMLEQFGAKMALLPESTKSEFSTYCAWYASKEAQLGAAAERVDAIEELPQSLGWVEDE